MRTTSNSSGPQPHGAAVWCRGEGREGTGRLLLSLICVLCLSRPHSQQGLALVCTGRGAGGKHWHCRLAAHSAPAG